MPLWRAAAPIVATVLLLAVTRIEPLGLRGVLTSDAPAATLDMGAAGTLAVSPALVVGWRGILGTDASWSMALLYVPFIIPFVLVVAATAPLLGLSARRVGGVAAGAARSLGGPAVALCGALVFVKLMMHGGAQSPVTAIGRALADGVSAVHPSLWLPAAPLLGALGAFFSGSATVSNLTFAPVQAEVAERLGLETTRVLALQCIGGAMGNMACVHNIVAVAAVLGLARRGPTAGAPNDKPPEAAAAGGAARSAPEGALSVSGGGDDPVAVILRLNIVPLAAFAGTAAAGAVVLTIVGW
jgi:lactate permease